MNSFQTVLLVGGLVLIIVGLISYTVVDEIKDSALAKKADAITGVFDGFANGDLGLTDDEEAIVNGSAVSTLKKIEVLKIALSRSASEKTRLSREISSCTTSKRKLEDDIRSQKETCAAAKKRLDEEIRVKSEELAKTKSAKERCEAARRKCEEASEMPPPDVPIQGDGGGGGGGGGAGGGGGGGDDGGSGLSPSQLGAAIGVPIVLLVAGAVWLTRTRFSRPKTETPFRLIDETPPNNAVVYTPRLQQPRPPRPPFRSSDSRSSIRSTENSMRRISFGEESASSFPSYQLSSVERSRQERQMRAAHATGFRREGPFGDITAEL